MSTTAPPRSQLTHAPLPLLTRIVFENIEVGQYYYVRQREEGYVPYDMFGRVSIKGQDNVRFDILYLRQGEDSEWESPDEDQSDDGESGTYHDMGRPSVNSDEQDDCARFYLPPGHSA